MPISSPAEAHAHQDVTVTAMAALAALAIQVFGDRFKKNALRVVGRVLAAVSFVGAITFVFFRVLPLTATTAGFFYLVAILTIATVGGLVESTIASIVAMLCFNFFFLPPVGTFTIADPQNWVALFTFLATSLVASQLSARAKRKTEEAVARQHEMEKLYSISRALLLTDPTRPMGNQIVQSVVQAFGFSAVALYERNSNEVYRAADGDLPDLDTKLRQAALRSTSFRDEENDFAIIPVRLGGQPIGSLAIRGSCLSDAALQSLLNLVAIGLERALSQETVNRAEVARRSEELKSTLLDALAHEFKTPLTSIKAVTTDLLSDHLPDHQRELVTVADEGTDRLSKLVTDAIQLARIEGGQFRLNRGIHLPKVLVSAALGQMKPFTDGRGISVFVAEDLPPVWVDANLIQMVITHILDNALKYSPTGSPIAFAARATDGRVVISISDRGPGIREDEQSRIFEKFYRGRRESNLKGSGMGLAIAREIVKVHGGEIWVASRAGEGSEFSFSLPVAA
jgi:two-component system, OmpR family, sensor histidine kinase KdpD